MLTHRHTNTHRDFLTWQSFNNLRCFGYKKSVMSRETYFVQRIWVTNVSVHQISLINLGDKCQPSGFNCARMKYVDY